MDEQRREITFRRSVNEYSHQLEQIVIPIRDRESPLGEIHENFTQMRELINNTLNATISIKHAINFVGRDYIRFLRSLDVILDEEWILKLAEPGYYPDWHFTVELGTLLDQANNHITLNAESSNRKTLDKVRTLNQNLRTTYPLHF